MPGHPPKPCTRMRRNTSSTLNKCGFALVRPHTIQAVSFTGDQRLIASSSTLARSGALVPRSDSSLCALSAFDQHANGNVSEKPRVHCHSSRWQPLGALTLGIGPTPHLPMRRGQRLGLFFSFDNCPQAPCVAEGRHLDLLKLECSFLQSAAYLGLGVTPTQPRDVSLSSPEGDTPVAPFGCDSRITRTHKRAQVFPAFGKLLSFKKSSQTNPTVSLVHLRLLPHATQRPESASPSQLSKGTGSPVHLQKLFVFTAADQNFKKLCTLRLLTTENML